MGQTKQQVENAAAFARLYGYVRFFHPADEAANLDWNRFAIYGAQQVDKCKNQQELKATLTELFRPIAPTVQIYLANQPPKFNTAVLTPPDKKDYQVVTWQHQGVKLDGASNTYQSARTNRPSTYKITDNGFGSASISIDANGYRGKEFIFRARVKVAQTPGTGHLWARVDRPDKKRGFFDNMNNRPIWSEAWQEYEIKGTVEPDAEEIFIGAFLKASGELWLDDLKLLVKEKDVWQEMYTNNFESETVGQVPNSMHTGALTYTYRIVSEAGGGKFLAIKKDIPLQVVEPTLLFKQQAQVGEYTEKTIGGGLKAIIPLALYGTKTQTYPTADKAKLEQLQKAMTAIPLLAITGDNLAVRQGNIAIAWNIFQHFYPYFDVAKTDWQKDLTTALTSAYTDKNEADFRRTLQRLTAKLKDGHVWVSEPGGKTNYFLPLGWEWVENQLVITDIYNPAIPLAIGDIVTSINGQKPEDYFKEVHQYISAATPGFLAHRAKTESLRGELGSTVNLRIKKADNKTAEVILKRELTSNPGNLKLPQPDSIKQLTDGIMYLNVGITSMAAINQALPQLQQSKVIICDLRGYPKSNHQFISYLLSRNDTSSQWMQTPHIIYPDQENIAGYRKSKWGMKPMSPHLKAKIIFLIDGRAISYAESYMSFIEHYKLATIVGQPTAGTNGNVNPFTLPGGYTISWTGMKVLKHDGSRHHGVGILPHVYVQKTIKGVRENRDEFLEKALEIAKSSK